MGRLEVDLWFIALPVSFLRKQESRTGLENKEPWIPAFAGMTYHKSEKAHVHYVHISPYFTSPQGEGFPPSPKGTLNFLTYLMIECLLSEQMIDKNNTHHRFTDRVDPWNG